MVRVPPTGVDRCSARYGGCRSSHLDCASVWCVDDGACVSGCSRPRTVRLRAGWDRAGVVCSMCLAVCNARPGHIGTLGPAAAIRRQRSLSLRPQSDDIRRHLSAHGRGSDLAVHSSRLVGRRLRADQLHIHPSLGRADVGTSVRRQLSIVPRCRPAIHSAVAAVARTIVRDEHQEICDTVGRKLVLKTILLLGCKTIVLEKLTRQLTARNVNVTSTCFR